MHRYMSGRLTSRLLLGALLALCPLAGYPLGLGKLKVHSALNEPLNAEIDITSISDNELKGLNVSVAPRADFEAAGVDRLPFLGQLKFTVAKRPDGRYHLLLKTDTAVEEPFLHLLLQVEWAGGRLVREYTALIDPPSYLVGKPPAVEAPQATPPVAAAPPPAVVETVPPPITEPAKPAQEPAVAAAPATPEPAPTPAQPLLGPDQKRETAVSPESGWPVDPAGPKVEALAETPPPTIPAPAPVAPAAPASASAWSGSAEYAVKPGDTLWSIAERVRADKQLSLEQVMVAIFKNNPDAFFKDNVNNLRAGKILSMPEREQVETATPAQARREFRAHYDVWQEYKLKLAAGSQKLTVTEGAAAAGEAPAAATRPQDGAAQPTTPAGAPGKQSDELLKITRSGEAEKAAGAKKTETESAKDVEKRERSALAERVSTLEESIESKQMENRELSEKVGQVRSQIKSEKRLMELENQALAQQSGKATEPKPAEPKPSDSKTSVTKPDAVKPEAKAEPLPPVAEAKKEPDAAPVKPVTVAPKPAVPAPAPTADKGFLASMLEDLFGDSFLPIVGGIVLVAGGIILIVYMRRRRRSIAEFEESILASDAIPSDVQSASAETTGQVTTGDTSFLSDFSKGGMGQVHTDEVDPIAEAEVYLAYGRDETAEEILKEAIVKNPERQELKQKLLEIYHQRNDANAFETLAEELYAALGGRGGKIWEKVEEMGRKLNPENPMFRGGAPARRAADQGAPAVSATFAVATSAPAGRGSNSPSASVMAAGTATAAGIAASAPTQVVEKEPDIDFDFDAVEVASPEASTDSGIDFDFNPGTTASQETRVVETKRAAPASKDGGLDSLDFGGEDNLIDFDSTPAEAPAAAPVVSAAAPAASGEDEIKWDFDAPIVEVAAAEAVDAPSPAVAQEGGHWDETATKLDLAKAYIDMGDSEGARSILDEVLSEGNEQQKKQAADLAAQIA